MSSMRRIVPFVLAAGLALVPAATLAHTELAEADPPDGSVLTEAPEEVTLTFEGELAEDAAFTVTGPSGDEVGTGSLDLDVADRNVIRGDVDVVDAGAYAIAWSVTGDDGHEVEGTLAFTYDPEGEPTTPDTAMAPTAARPLQGSGVLLLALATVAILATVTRRFVADGHRG